MQSTDVETCGHASPARWRCDACDDDLPAFLACSSECLDRHFDNKHGSVRRRSHLERATAALRAKNEPNERNRSDFEPHRAKLMELLSRVRGEGALCVLGAGNCDDLDLSGLVRAFGEVHLVDLDRSALRKALERVDVEERRSIVLHEGVDLTGLLGSVDTWAESEAALAVMAKAAARAIASAIGRTFRVVLSSCVVSQLCVPFFRILARSGSEWADFMEKLGRIHLDTIALLMRPGGTGVLVGDSLYVPRAAESSTPVPTWETLDPVAEDRLRNGPMLLRNPQFLLSLLHEPEIAAKIERPEITQPWLWTVEDSVMLVYAVLLRKRASTETDEPLTAIHVRSNRDTELYWDLYAEHRHRMTSLVTSRKTGGTVCILGAGNGNAFDLEELAARFTRIHLVDVDADALARARERASPATRERLVLHAPVDISGLMKLLPRWHGVAPERAELDALSETVPALLAASLPGTFDVVLSDCVLTQIYWTCFKALGNGPVLHQVLAAALSIHLRTMEALTAPRGAAILATDAVTSETLPLAELYAARAPHELLRDLEAQGALFSGTGPSLVQAAFERAGLAQTFAAPELAAPWIWNVGRKRAALVYALTFERK